MTNVSVAETRLHLAEILGKVAYGKETFVISKKGRPMARLVPIVDETHAETKPLTLATMPGWLDENDPFFDDLSKIRKESRSQKMTNPFRSKK